MIHGPNFAPVIEFYHSEFNMIKYTWLRFNWQQLYLTACLLQIYLRVKALV